MKTLNCLSSLVICSILLTLGCARTQPSSAPKPAGAPKPTAQQEAPVTDLIEVSASTLTSPTGDGSEAQRELVAGSVTTTTPNDGATAPTMPVVTTDEVLAYVASLNIPLTAPFAAPKYDKKEEVNFLVGHNCSKLLKASKKKGGVGNLAKSIPDAVCNTVIGQSGSPKVTVVPKKYIVRKSGKNGIVSSFSESYEILLRGDGTMAATRHSVTANGVFKKSQMERIEIATPQGVRITSKRDAVGQELSLATIDRNVDYGMKAKYGSRNAPLRVIKTLTVKNFRGMSLSVIEKAETSYTTALDRIKDANISCNVLVIQKDLTTILSTTLPGRCFHR